MEQAFINTVIAFKIMQYSQSLICFFKEEFIKDNGYIIPYSHILYVKRHIFPLIRDACDYVCPQVFEFCGKTNRVSTSCRFGKEMLFSRFLFL